jgi:hypothetical protein
VGYFDRQSPERMWVQKFNQFHDGNGRFSSADDPAVTGPIDRRAEMANTPERHFKAAEYHTARAAALKAEAPLVAEIHEQAAFHHRKAATSPSYYDRRDARDLSVYAHATEDARRT